jgi:glycine hydroxymethyltransferase
MAAIVDLIDEVITHPEEEEVVVKVKEKVNKLMKNLPLFNGGQ